MTIAFAVIIHQLLNNFEWTGGAQGTGERDYAPGYARLLASDRDFAAGTADLARMESDARWLADVLELPAVEGEA